MMVWCIYEVEVEVEVDNDIAWKPALEAETQRRALDLPTTFI